MFWSAMATPSLSGIVTQATVNPLLRGIALSYHYLAFTGHVV